MQGKFEINQDYYSSENCTLIYVENRVGSKALPYLKFCLQLNFITPFTTINNLFNHNEVIFDNLY